MLLKNENIQKDDRLLRYANIINDQNNRLNNQVEKVLQIARLEGDTFELKKEHVNVNELLEKWEAGWGCLFSALDSINIDNFDN